MRRSVAMILMSSLVASTVTVGLATAAHATVLNVDSADPLCSDSTGAPYCTLQAAANDASSGDTIHVAAGVYTGTGVAVLDTSLDPKDLTITGAGTGETFISGETDRVGMRLYGPASYAVSELTVSAGASSGSGAGIYVQGGATVDLENVSIQNNVAAVSGGGIYNHSSILTITGGNVSSNTATSTDGGGIHNHGGTVTLLSTLVNLNSAGGTGGGVYSNGGTVELHDVTVQQNTAVDFGGGVAAIGTDPTLTIYESDLVGNTASESGGGAYFDASTDGFLGVEDTSVRFNHTDVGAATGMGGGGMFLDGGTLLSIERSLFEGNTSTADGGGLHHANLDNLDVTNTTFTGNDADANGGGAFARGLFTNATFTDNSAGNDGGGLSRNVLGNSTVSNSIVAGNSAGTTSDDCWGATSAGHNLISTVSGVCFSASNATDVVLTDPLLAPLADNGGATRTHAIDPDSLAFNAGNPATPGSGAGTCADHDQRGVPRGEDQCDIGAFEVQLGSVTGTVTRAEGGDPLSGIEVTLHADSAAVATVMSDSGGEYVFSSVVPGDYTVEFVDPHSVTLDQWWPAKDAEADAETVTVSGGAAASGIDAAMVVDPPFPDVPSDHPFGFEIAWLANEGVTGGYEDGTFRPAASVSRQAMAAFLYRYAGEPAFDAPGVPTFPDVVTEHTFFAEIEWLADEEVAGGYLDGTFRPTAQVSRQAMAAFLYRFAGEPSFAAPASASFTDVETDHPFFLEVEWLVAQGVTGGYEDGTFRPTAPVSRQAMAAFLYRYGEAVE